jgi:hypothetical protein
MINQYQLLGALVASTLTFTGLSSSFLRLVAANLDTRHILTSAVASRADIGDRMLEVRYGHDCVEKVFGCAG